MGLVPQARDATGAHRLDGLPVVLRSEGRAVNHYIGKDKTFDVVGKTLDAVDAMAAAVTHSEHEYHWRKLRAYAEALFAMAPFRPGDRVRLTKTPEISEKVAWGWLGAKHMMVEGATATVQGLDFSGGHFEAWVYMDNETYRSSRTGELKPVDRPALYHFWDTGIERVAPCMSVAGAKERA